MSSVMDEGPAAIATMAMTPTTVPPIAAIRGTTNKCKKTQHNNQVEKRLRGNHVF